MHTIIDMGTAVTDSNVCSLNLLMTYMISLEYKCLCKKYTAALRINNLNSVIRNATSLNIFKSAYLKFHFSH